jgi:hypothetical protein
MGILHQDDSKPLNRICIFSQRYMLREFYRSSNYEFEDVICEVDDVELIAPIPDHRLNLRQRLSNRYLSPHISLIPYETGIKNVIRVEQEYEMFFTTIEFLADLVMLDVIKKWRKRCKICVCFLTEIWAQNIRKRPDLIKVLSKFDYIFVVCTASVKPLKQEIQRPCFSILAGIDTIRFCPYPNPVSRSIDVYGMGRYIETAHKQLKELANAGKIFYLFDAYDRQDPTKDWLAKDHREHRCLTSNLTKRSRYFIVNPAKMDQAWETGGQVEIGYRFFEGAAAGTVMIGQHPETELFYQNFDWPDAVIPIPDDGTQIAEFLAKLDAQPERLEKARRNNVINSLLRHDWVYRWREILETVGLEPKPALHDRVKRLKNIAKGIQEMP